MKDAVLALTVCCLPLCGCLSRQNTGPAKDVFYYSQFGAKGNGKTDDFGAIIKTHEAANRTGVCVKADPGAVYYIGGAAKTAVIQTDTDWTGAEFIIDDTKVAPNGNAWNDNWIFEIASAQPSISLLSSPVQTLGKNQENIGLALSSDSVIVATDDQTKRYIRRGENENSGSNQTDVFVVNKNGDVRPDTPVLWDFKRFSTLTAYPIDDNILTVTGGKFTTVANRGIADSSYMKRGIRVSRSNTVIDGLTHLVTGEGEQGAAYSGFFYFENCANVTLKNTTLTGHRGYAEKSGTVRGSYDIQPVRTVNLELKNCRQTNSITDSAYWGIFGSNYSKNILFDDVIFSRFDAHCGVHNATILNSELGYQQINLIGSGTVYIENTKVYSSRFINLRSDYGSTWEGDVIIKNCTFVPPNWGSVVIFTSNDGQWNFGYPCFMPDTITIEGLTVDETALPETGTSGINLLYAVYVDVYEPYPYTPAQTINLSGFKSSRGWRISEHLKNIIKVNEI